MILASTPPRNVVAAYTEPGSAAASAPANLARGAQILTVDGVDLVNASDQASVNTLNAGLSPKTVGESHIFSVLDEGAASPRTVTLVSADITETPVQNVHTIQAGENSSGTCCSTTTSRPPRRNLSLHSASCRARGCAI